MGNQRNYSNKNKKTSEGHRGTSRLDKSRQISRDNKNVIRRQIYQVYERENNQYQVDILFIENETANNERVLLETVSLENGMYSVELPSLTSEILYLPKDEMKAVISESFDIEFDDICFTIQADKNRRGLIAIRGIKKNKSDLTSFVVRTYNPATWFNGRKLTQMRNVAYYNGTLTDNYFASKEPLGNIVVSTNLLLGILDYRLVSGKLDKYKWFNGSSKNLATADFIDILMDSNIVSRLEQEEKELALLMYGEGSNKKTFAQDIGKFLGLRAKLEEYRQRLHERELGIVTSCELEDGTNVIADEKQYVFSLFYGKNRKPMQQKKGD